MLQNDHISRNADKFGIHDIFTFFQRQRLRSNQAGNFHPRKETDNNDNGFKTTLQEKTNNCNKYHPWNG